VVKFHFTNWKLRAFSVMNLIGKYEISNRGGGRVPLPPPFDSHTSRIKINCKFNYDASPIAITLKFVKRV